jgi:hypothetical protein
VERSTTPPALCHRPHEQRGVAEAGSRGHRAGPAGLGVLGAQSDPLALDALPSGPLVALAPGGHQGRGVQPRRQHALRRDGYGPRPPSRALATALLCPWPRGKREQRPPRCPCQRSARRVTAARPSKGACYGMRRPLGSWIPAAVRCEGPPRGPVPRWQRSRCASSNWAPRARVQGTDHYCVALVVSGGAGIAALLHVVRVCTSEAAGPVSARATAGSSSLKR